MAGLLVSVRSPAEALAALAGGATLIDIKEPANGPLGRAEPVVWAEIRSVLPPAVPVSIALGELTQADLIPGQIPAGVSFAKLGLAAARPCWRDDWASVRHRLQRPAMTWVAVTYADWRQADAPDPDEILDEAISATDCGVILVDTFIKGPCSPLDLSWRPWVERARAGGLQVALAGGLDLKAIERLQPLKPDWFAVRGAACKGSDRAGVIDTNLVAELVSVVVG